MKLTKTQWILVAVVSLAIWYFFLRKKDEGTKKENGYYMYNPNEDSLNSPYFDAYGSDGTESGYNYAHCNKYVIGGTRIAGIKRPFKSIQHLYRPIEGKDIIKTDRNGNKFEYFSVKYKLINENSTNYSPLPVGYMKPKDIAIFEYPYRYTKDGKRMEFDKIKSCLK